MSITLYDLCAADEDKRFSPACWRAKMALAHKGLAFESVATPFTKIPEIEGGATKTVPFIVDGDDKVGDSFDIAVYLDEKYPDAPALFGSESDVAAARFVKAWANTTLHPGVAGLVVKDIHDLLAEPDQKYFRESREKMFG
ncbi:MAG: glutathione S-transferase family protein, partial [Pseudomonadota bacterium]